MADPPQQPLPWSWPADIVCEWILEQAHSKFVEIAAVNTKRASYRDIVLFFDVGMPDYMKVHHPYMREPAATQIRIQKTINCFMGSASKAYFNEVNFPWMHDFFIQPPEGWEPRVIPPHLIHAFQNYNLQMERYRAELNHYQYQMMHNPPPYWVTQPGRQQTLRGLLQHSSIYDAPRVIADFSRRTLPYPTNLSKPILHLVPRDTQRSPPPVQQEVIRTTYPTDAEGVRLPPWRILPGGLTYGGRQDYIEAVLARDSEDERERRVCKRRERQFSMAETICEMTYDPTKEGGISEGMAPMFRDYANLKIIIQAQQMPESVRQGDLNKAYEQFFNDHPGEIRETHQMPPQPQTPVESKNKGKQPAREGSE